VSYGRLLTEPASGRIGAPFRLRPDTPLDPAKVNRCAAGADGKRMTSDDWEKCGGGVVVDVVAEGWGQGHARASAVGSAGMMATLAAAANGQTQVRRPHLVQAIRGVGVHDANLDSATIRWSLAQSEPNRVPQEVANVILGGLSFSHRAGTARLACEQVFDAKTCRDIDWIAGKTGTPTFPNDDRSLDELARLCAQPLTSRSDRAACGPLRPYKWYVAAYRSDPSDRKWTKVIAVLTERNWLADTGRIHGAGDHGPNPAAEIAMQIAGRHVGALRSGE
jgi:cell division protein FtsI/penicillin-binding protein 2